MSSYHAYFLRGLLVEPPPLRVGGIAVPELREGVLSVRGDERGVSCVGASSRGRVDGSV